MQKTDTESMCTLKSDTTKPDPPARIGLTVQQALCCLSLVFVNGVRTRLDINRHKLVGLCLPVDVRADMLLKDLVAPPGKLVVVQLSSVHGTAGAV